MERKTKSVMGKLRLPFFRRWKGQRASSSASTDVSADAFILFDKSFDIVGMNPLARTLFHLILGEKVISEDILNGAPSVKPDNKNNGRYGRYLNAIRKGKPFFADSIVIHSGFLDINLKAEAFKVGKGFGIIFSDLDTLKKSAETQYESHGVWTTEFESAPDYIFIFDLEGTILHGSRAGEKLTGYPWEEVRGKSFFALPLFTPEYLPKAAQLLELSAAGKPTGPYEFELIKKDGSRIFVDISTCPIGRGEEIKVIGIARDITERKQAEEAVRQSEEKYRAIVETSLDGIYQVDASGKLIFINESFADIFGYRREELLGKHFSSLLNMENFPKVKEKGEEIFSGKNVRGEVSLQHKDGHEVPVTFSATPLKDREKIIGLTGILRDVTEHRKAEENLRESEEALANSEAKYRSLIETAGAGVAAIDLRGEFVLTNEALCRMIGYSKEELSGRNFADFLHPDDKNEVLEIFVKRLAGESKRPHLEFRIIHKDGHNVWCYSNPTAIVRGNELIGFSAIIYDVTERKNVEEALKESEERYRALVETSGGAGDGIIIAQNTEDREGAIVFVNDEYCSITGYSKEELLDKTVWDLVPSVTIPEIQERYKRRQAGGDIPRHYETRLVRKDGVLVPVESFSGIIKYNGKTATVTYARDITGRKQMEEALKQSGELLKAQFDSSPDTISILDRNFKFVKINRILVDPYTTKGLVGRDAIATLPPSEQGRVRKQIAECFDTGEAQDIEHEIGEGRWVRARIAPIKSDGVVKYVMVLSTDITERKKVEEALRESEEKWRSLSENSPDSIALIDLDRTILFMNRTVPDLTKEVIRASAFKYVPPEYHQTMADCFKHVEASGKPDMFTTVYHAEEGRDRHFEVRIGPVFKNGRVVAFTGSSTDITERKKLEECLKASEEKYRDLFNNAQVGLFRAKISDGRLLECNDLFARMFGYNSREECLAGFVASQRYVDIYVRELVLRVIQEKGEISNSEVQVTHRDGTPFWMSCCAKIYSERGYIEGVAIDISERKRIEEALRESEERFRRLVDHAPDIIFRWSVGKGLDYISPVVTAITGYTPEEVMSDPSIGLRLTGQFDKRVREYYERVVKEGRSEFIRELSLLRKDGKQAHLDMRTHAVKDDKGKVIAFEGILRDITEQKLAEAALRQSERNYRALFESETDGLMVIDAETLKIVLVNQSTAEMFGFNSPEEAIGVNAFEVIHPEERDDAIKLLRDDVFEKDMHKTNEARCITKDGRVIWTNVVGTRTEYQGRRAYLASIRDITERKKAEEALKESEERYRALVDTAGLAGEGIMIVEGTERNKSVISFVNDAIVTILGYQREEILGMPIWNLFLPGDHILLRDKNGRRRRGEALPSHYAVMALRKDGSMLPIEISMGAMTYHGQSAMVVYIRDVTEREKAHEELLRHTKRVEAQHAIAQLTSQTLELEELLKAALEKLVEVMGADAGCVYLLDMAEKELMLKTYRGIPDDVIARVATIKLSENNVQRMMQWKDGVSSYRQILDESSFVAVEEIREEEQIQSFAAASFAVRGQLSGLIAVGNRSQRQFSSGDMDLLRAVGNQIGISTQNAMLYEEVRALIRETIDAQERERERVCLEVHDGVAQTLVSAFQYLQALEATAPDDAQTRQMLAKATTQIKQAIQESREVINSLQPATLSDLGLVATLRHELKRLGQETGLKVDFKADAIRLPNDVEIGLYRIIREAIFNARKHANTKQLRVKIKSEDGGVKVEVRDWGKGFDQAYLDRARRRGTGLFSIRKRAELLKGTCEIQSKPGEGTTVCVDIPFVDAK